MKNWWHRKAKAKQSPGNILDLRSDWRTHERRQAEQDSRVEPGVSPTSYRAQE